MALANSIEVTPMPMGRVKWFNNAKGFGFILPLDDGVDCFVHHSSIVMEGYRTLKAGQSVIFEMVDGPKGTHAVNVSLQDQQRASSEEENSNGNSARAPAE
jgi:CspA family cold shock protein